MKFKVSFLSGIIFTSLIYSQQLLLSPKNPIFEDIRRIQSRAHSVYAHQQSGWNVKDMLSYREVNMVTRFERYQFENRFPFSENSLLNWNDTIQNKSLHFSVEAIGGFVDTSHSSWRMGPGLRLHGQLTDYLTFYTSGRAFTEYSEKKEYTHSFSPRYGETCSVEDGSSGELRDTRTCARFEYYLNLNLDWLQLTLGRDHIHMGPGYFSSLTAHKNTPPYYMVRAYIPFSNWMSVDNYILRMADTENDVVKRAHIHRFEFRPHYSLALAFQDIVIYQDRDIDPAYVIPLIPLAFSEDNTGGRDNDGMSFDFMFTGVAYLSIWGELFLDDLVGPSTFFDDVWENRWSFLAGFQFVSPIRQVDADFILEFSRVEPWTYNGRQAHTSFRHFNVPSASKLGPDARTLDLQLSYRPHPFVYLKERMEFNEKGTQPGAILGTIHDDGLHGTTKEFLKGNTLSQQIFRHEFGVFFKRYLHLHFAFTQILGDLSDNNFEMSLNIAL